MTCCHSFPGQSVPLRTGPRTASTVSTPTTSTESWEISHYVLHFQCDSTSVISGTNSSEFLVGRWRSFLLPKAICKLFLVFILLVISVAARGHCELVLALALGRNEDYFILMYFMKYGWHLSTHTHTHTQLHIHLCWFISFHLWEFYLVSVFPCIVHVEA